MSEDLFQGSTVEVLKKMLKQSFSSCVERYDVVIMNQPITHNKYAIRAPNAMNVHAMLPGSCQCTNLSA